MLLVAGQCGELVIGAVDSVIDDEAAVPLRFQLRDAFVVFAFPGSDYWRQDLDWLVVSHLLHDMVNHLVDGGLCDAMAAVDAVLLANFRVEQSEVVVDFGDSTYR